MPKGFFSQGVCLLTDGSTTIEGVRAALERAGFSIVKAVPASEFWSFSGPALLLAYLPQVNGSVTIDVVNHPWPDAMGDPKADPMTFGAWGMGHFGPFAYPGGLQRAMEQSWGWEAARLSYRSIAGSFESAVPMSAVRTRTPGACRRITSQSLNCSLSAVS
jgi:hypothetical protein